MDSVLALTFEANTSQSAFAPSASVELVPNGRNISVNQHNKFLFVNLLANFRLNECGEELTEFFKGFYSVVKKSYIENTFSEKELQLLMSGDLVGKIDLADLKSHCHYAGGEGGSIRENDE